MEQQNILGNYLDTFSQKLPPANEIWGKVIFSQASVILFPGGSGFPACITGHMTRGVCIQGRSVSRRVCIQMGVGGLGRYYQILWYTVNRRAVRFLLDYILVSSNIHSTTLHFYPVTCHMH